MAWTRIRSTKTKTIFSIMASGVLSFFLICTHSDIASARGGGSNIMNSPGYQRALRQSREAYRRAYYGQPYVAQPRVYPGRKWRQRGTRY